MLKIDEEHMIALLDDCNYILSYLIDSVQFEMGVSQGSDVGPILSFNDFNAESPKLLEYLYLLQVINLKYIFTNQFILSSNLHIFIRKI